jgi:hypothetical protein
MQHDTVARQSFFHLDHKAYIQALRRGLMAFYTNLQLFI